MSVVVSGPIGKNGGIQQFSAACTLPSIERTYKIIKFLSEHAAFATWTMHRIPPATVIIETGECLHLVCQQRRLSVCSSNK